MSDRIAEIRERHRLAFTESGWEARGVERGNWFVATKDSHETGDYPTAEVRDYNDAEFIAHAPDDIAFLLARLSAITDALDREKLADVVRDAFRTGGWVVPPSIGLTAADAVRSHVLGEEQN